MKAKALVAVSAALVVVASWILFVDTEPVSSGVSEEFTPGTYDISEATNGTFPGGTFNQVISCNDPEFDGTDTVTLSAGENISCTIKNTETD